MRKHRRFGPKSVYLTLAVMGIPCLPYESIAIFATKDGVLQKVEHLSDGLATSARLTSGLVKDLCEANGCDEVILAHTHPYGACVPSPEDVAVTYRLMADLAEYNIRLRDHIIVTREEYLSMKRKGFLK